MQKIKFWVIIGNVTLLIWSVVVLALFMYFPGALSHMHQATLYNFSMVSGKLLRLPVASFFLDTLVSFIGMMFFGASCVSAGLKLATIFHLDEVIKNDAHLPESILLPTYFLVGNVVFSLIFLTLASLSHLSPTHSIIILSLGLLSGLKQFKKLPVLTIQINTSYEKVVIGLSILLLTVSLFQSSAHLSYDASATYFSMAKLTALERQIGYFLENVFPASVFHAVIQYTAVMQVFGDQSARMISWLFGVMNIVIAMSLAELVGVPTLARRILPALILTSTAFLDQMGDGKVELFSSAYALMAIFWMTVKVHGSRHNLFLYFLSGCFIGFSCILRPYNAFLLGIFVFAHITQQIKTRQFSILQSAHHIAWMALGAIGFALYHFFINDIIFGSPFAFWNSVTAINPEGPWDFKPEIIWTYRLLYPFVVIFKNSGASLGNITPLVLVFLPMLLVLDIRGGIILQKDTAELVISAAVALFSWVLLFFTIVEVRYVMFLWIILFIPIAEIAARAFERGNILLRIIAVCSIVTLMGFTLVRSAYISIFTYSPLDDQGNPQCFDNGICGQIKMINGTASSGDRVLTLSAYRYYLRSDLFACSTDHDEYKILKDFTKRNNMDEFWLEVYRRGYKYIAYENDYTTRHLEFKTMPGPENTPEWMELEPIFGNPGDLQVAYKINVHDPPVAPELTCQKNSLGVWKVKPVTP